MASKKRWLRLSGIPLAALGLLPQVGLSACTEPPDDDIEPQAPPQDIIAPQPPPQGDMSEDAQMDMDVVAPQPPPQPNPGDMGPIPPQPAPEDM